MNKVKLNDVIKSGNLVIPMYVLKEYSKFDLTLDEFVLLIYLYNNNNIIYDPELLSNKLGISIENVLIGVDSLGNKGLLSLDSFTNSNGVLEEKINMDIFYEKITLSLINELNEEISDNNIFSLIEKEFDRKLKPNEQELVISLQKDYSDELIKEALKEAKNNNPTVRYMDQVLFDWKKQGVKSLDDINKIKEVSNEPVDSIINVKWFEDDEV
jgi:DNA replication protein